MSLPSSQRRPLRTRERVSCFPEFWTSGQEVSRAGFIG
jgi:hypothetical protein